MLLPHARNIFLFSTRFMSTSKVKYISGDVSYQIDQELMGEEYSFSIDQLMELAGLAVARVCHRQHPPISSKKVLVLVGPGNNGGDGLVTARHLKHYGYSPFILYPKQPQKELYIRLTKQCKTLDIPVESSVDSFKENHADDDWELIVDALFGFSFKPPVRSPFDELLPTMIALSQKIPVVSVDIPSGWDVQNGPGSKYSHFQPATLVSLTAPKCGSIHFKGNHWLGGRFVPKSLEKKFELNIPHYPGSDDIVLLPKDA